MKKFISLIICTGLLASSGPVTVLADPTFQTATYRGNESLSTETESGQSPTAVTLENRQTDVCDGYTCPNGRCVATSEDCRPDTELAKDKPTSTKPTPRPSDWPSGSMGGTINREPLPDPECEVICPDGSCVSTSTACRSEEPETTLMPNRRPFDHIGSFGDDEASSGEKQTAKSPNLDHERPPTDEKPVVKNTFIRDKPHVSLSAKFASHATDLLPGVVSTASGYIKLGGVDGDTKNQPADPGVNCLHGRLDDDGNLLKLGAGVCLHLVSETDAGAGAGLSAEVIRLDGRAIRNWTEEERQAWSGFLPIKEKSGTEDKAITEVAPELVELMNKSELIDLILADRKTAAIEYRLTFKLLGFIPLERSLVAEMVVGEKPQLKLPWYRLISRIPEKRAVESVMAELMSKLEPIK